ncbi:MAG: ribosome biogenesis GTP-binding protein YihA/YsxC [Bacteroidota bacterium]|nr:ribosome biogenesis GTP-binding protein YihA/YsxC [Bacteroidota bacterium]
MFNKLEFIKPVYSLKEIPSPRRPEIILCGRSNVGKSSFINSIFNRKNLAKTSSTPGKTRSMNYYNVDDKLYMVDLPGFGYAKTAKTERDNWAKLIDEFLEQSGYVSLAFHLIDSRHDPLESDLHLNMLLREIDLPYIVILNKIDKLSQSEIALAKKKITNFFPELSYGDNLMQFSSIKGTGKKEVLSRISSLFYK